MKLRLNATITKLTNRTRGMLVPFLLLLAIACSVFAHGGFDHVMGTVVKVTGDVLTVKTAKGDVDVKLNEKTEITKDAAKAQLSDLTAGVRVVVDIPEGNKEKLAHSVKIGVAQPATAAHHN